MDLHQTPWGLCPGCARRIPVRVEEVEVVLRCMVDHTACSSAFREALISVAIPRDPLQKGTRIIWRFRSAVCLVTEEGYALIGQSWSHLGRQLSAFVLAGGCTGLRVPKEPILSYVTVHEVGFSYG